LSDEGWRLVDVDVVRSVCFFDHRGSGSNGLENLIARESVLYLRSNEGFVDVDVARSVYPFDHHGSGTSSDGLGKLNARECVIYQSDEGNHLV
jgi:hypothetical protein